MSDELIRKSDVLDLLDDLGLNLIDYDIYSQLFDTVDNMPPVNAVELPCKIGDTVYEVIEECGAKGSFDCAYNGGHGYSRCGGRFAGKCEAYIQETHFVLSDFGYVGERIFLTREEAEKALEDLKNENK